VAVYKSVRGKDMMEWMTTGGVFKIVDRLVERI